MDDKKKIDSYFATFVQECIIPHLIGSDDSGTRVMFDAAKKSVREYIQDWQHSLNST